MVHINYSELLIIGIQQLSQTSWPAGYSKGSLNVESGLVWNLIWVSGLRYEKKGGNIFIVRLNLVAINYPSFFHVVLSFFFHFKLFSLSYLTPYVYPFLFPSVLPYFIFCVGLNVCVQPFSFPHPCFSSYILLFIISLLPFLPVLFSQKKGKTNIWIMFGSLRVTAAFQTRNFFIFPLIFSAVLFISW